MKHLLTVLLFMLLVTRVLSQTQTASAYNSDKTLVSKVLSSFYVGFSFLEEKEKLYMAYYDSLHQMTLATYDIKNKKLDYQILPSVIKWDSHNYITMAFDKEGFLHVSGNMHAEPLVYFRSAVPYDIHSMRSINLMTGIDEKSVTYPSFMKTNEDELLFHYRTGGSGNGSEIFNIYSTESKTWKRFMDKSLIDGEGKRSAYMQGPVLGKDGYYHLIWVWRETPDCSTNHTLSYARSKNLLNWENISGIETVLPITFSKTDFYVDATPVKGGLYNPGIKLGFTSNNEPIIGYHKYDENGYNQLYVAKYINGQWKCFKLTDWKYRWNFGGYGSMKDEIVIMAPQVISDGKMSLRYEHVKEGKGEVIFDENTFVVVDNCKTSPFYLNEELQLRSSCSEMKVYTLFCGDYVLKWEALPPNRDRKPDGSLPEATDLILYKWR